MRSIKKWLKRLLCRHCYVYCYTHDGWDYLGRWQHCKVSVYWCSRCGKIKTRWSDNGEESRHRGE